ncbi:MAG: hypothetical protein EXR28_06955 [Betaproteobacteria bacterium]|nr:hypothetical protein [Betaproteobacteria bacterium]
MSEPETIKPLKWAAAWPDVLAFAAGLAVAWLLEWKTRDLVWSMWLSSLVVGYAMIVQGAFAPMLLGIREGRVSGALFALANGVAALVFFTLHFGLFHFAQAAFLIDFFPLVEQGQSGDFENLAQALLRYWWFVPAAALAERRAFILPPMPPEPPPTSVKGTDIEVRKARQIYGAAQMWRPYINVVRMHLLIFFIAFAQIVDFWGFTVYAVVYAAYFFPWRLLQRPTGAADSANLPG